MQVILLERIEHLGKLGDTVTVKPGYARNFLLPTGKALRATKENIAYFDAQKKHLEADNAAKKAEAEKVAKKLENLEVVITRAASEAGKLYGAVSARDIADAINAKAKTDVSRNAVVLNVAYKDLGLFPVTIALHGEVKVKVTLNIARSEEEAALQKAAIEKAAKEAEKAAKAAKEAKEAEEGNVTVVPGDAAEASAETEEKPAKKAKAKKSEEAAEEKPAKAAKKSKKAE